MLAPDAAHLRSSAMPRRWPTTARTISPNSAPLILPARAGAGVAAIKGAGNRVGSAFASATTKCVRPGLCRRPSGCVRRWLPSALLCAPRPSCSRKASLTPSSSSNAPRLLPAPKALAAAPVAVATVALTDGAMGVVSRGLTVLRGLIPLPVPAVRPSPSPWSSQPSQTSQPSQRSWHRRPRLRQRPTSRLRPTRRPLLWRPPHWRPPHWRLCRLLTPSPMPTPRRLRPASAKPEGHHVDGQAQSSLRGTTHRIPSSR